MSFLSFGKVKSVALQTMSGGALPIAVDFGVSSLKLLQLQSGEPPSLICAAAVQTPDSLLSDPAKRLQFQIQALPRAVKAGRFKGKRAVCSIPSGLMFCKHMQFPRAPDVELGELVKVAVPEALEVPSEALVLRHFAVEGAQTPGSTGSTGGSGARQEVICMAASRDLVNRLMGAIREAKLEPVGIQPEAIATIKAFEFINRRAADANLSTLYLDLACGTTKVWITHGSSLVFAKVILMGGHDLDLAVAHALDLKLSDARARRLAASVLVAPARPVPGAVSPAGTPKSALASNGGSNDGTQAEASPESAAAMTAEERRMGQVAPGLTVQVAHQEQVPVAPPEFDLNDHLERLTDEIAMCLRYYEAMFPGRRVDRAVFFGGEARHRGLCQHIAKRIRLGAQVADPMARMARTGSETVLGADFSTPQPGWTIAFGLSLCPTDF